jgi:tRNA (guanine-N7-)-methyltransferase
VPAWKPLGGDLWQTIFGNDHPIFIEIGPGRGEFLLRGARENPGHNFFAIERSARRSREIREKLERETLTNARVLRADGQCVLAMLPDECVHGYYIQFPDPWWKRRHHHRRIFSSSFVADLRRTLLKGGFIELITDVPEYFEGAVRLLNRDAELEIQASGPHLTVATAFARKAGLRNAHLYCSRHQRRVS